MSRQHVLGDILILPLSVSELFRDNGVSTRTFVNDGLPLIQLLVEGSQTNSRRAIVFGNISSKLDREAS